MATEHVLDPELVERWRTRSPLNVLVIGCGGTGSAFACGLPYLHQAMRAKGLIGLDVKLMDGDLISETNCVRQPFSRGEVGLFKSVVLASRLNMFWNLRWEGIGGYLTEKSKIDADLVVGCVDSRSGRRLIHELLTKKSCFANYWLDIGNTASTGQIVLGQPWNARNRQSPARLRSVAEMYPEILNSSEEDEETPSCSAIDALTKQQPFINQTLAMQALAMLSRLIWDGKIEYHGMFTNLVTGRTTPLPIDPRQWQRLKRWERKAA
jgi:PRTRC genetic system ThiF family protein